MPEGKSNNPQGINQYTKGGMSPSKIQRMSDTRAIPVPSTLKSKVVTGAKNIKSAIKDYSAIGAAGAKGAIAGLKRGPKSAMNDVPEYNYDTKTGKLTQRSKAKVIADKIVAAPVGAAKGAYYEANWQAHKEAGKRNRLK